MGRPIRFRECITLFTDCQLLIGPADAVLSDYRAHKKPEKKKFPTHIVDSYRLRPTEFGINHAVFEDLDKKMAR